MKYGKLVFLVMAVSFLSCNNDDNDQVEVVPPRLLAEVAPENDEEIQEFLNTHFYNYEEFSSPPADFDYKIIIDTIAGANADKTPLADLVEEMTINVSSSQLGLSEEENDVPHTMYYLLARDNDNGLIPTVADSVLLRYEGMLLDGSKFDASESFLWQVLPFTIRGYGNGVARIPAATEDGLVVNPDGTFGFTNSGIGLMIMPSGLAYFAGGGPTGDLPQYSNLIFQIEVGRIIEDTDSDNDGVPSILEDINGNGYLFDDNTDSETESAGGAFADFVDGDDDGDGVSTRTEITDDQGNIIFPYPDSDGDNIPDYLDPDTN